MKSNLSRPQIITIALSVFMIVLILLLPKIPSNTGSSELPGMNMTGAISKELKEVVFNGLAEERKEKIVFLENQLETARNTGDKLRLADSLAFYWRVYGKPEMEAEYLRRSAQLTDDEERWFVAGDAFFNGFSKTEEKFKKYMISQAIACYDHILNRDPENLKAMNALGVSHVEGAAYLGEQPMIGIGMIRDVLEKDPENIDALVNLGYFAIQSGQYDKAIERYQQVLEIDPAHVEAYLYLTDVYLKTGEKEKAISSLEHYKRSVTDQSVIAQINGYIDEIKRNN